jgi:hypothetical protein
LQALIDLALMAGTDNNLVLSLSLPGKRLESDLAFRHKARVN